MSTETDAIRAQADQIKADANKIDKEQNAGVVEAINQLDAVILPALEVARVGAQTASEALKKSLNQ